MNCAQHTLIYVFRVRPFSFDFCLACGNNGGWHGLADIRLSEDASVEHPAKYTKTRWDTPIESPNR